MPELAAFSDSYAEARKKFLDAARRAGAKLTSYRHPTERGPGGEIRIELLERVDAGTRKRIDAERERLRTWLGDVRIKTRFPTPVERAVYVLVGHGIDMAARSGADHVHVDVVHAGEASFPLAPRIRAVALGRLLDDLAPA